MAAFALALAGAVGSAQAATVQATVTADNHYALYNVNDGVINFVGRNEVGPVGEPGTYNWSIAETWNFQTDDVIYIAAWSDDFFAQGLLGEFNVVGGPTIYTGNPIWQVYRTGIGRDGADPAPSTAEMTAQIAFATSNNLFRPASVGQLNTPAATPWGQIANIDSDARWIWADVPAGQDPFEPGFDWDEYLIFCAVIPSPGSIALVGLGGLVAFRRERRK
jgi:hypothetical protein